MPTVTQQTTLLTETGETVHLTRQLASSGEGVVWETDRQNFLAKVYHTATPDRIAKLRVMVANPPYDPMLRQSHISFAWPQALLFTPQGQPVGFLMPAIRDSVKLSSIYNPRLRNRKAPRFNWYYLHATALNVASVIESIHAKGYVVGDIKPQNLLVNNRALVSVIDTDSFQILDPQSQQIYRCLVGSEGFTPPELMGKELGKLDQSEVHDRYRLGVLVYLLLFGDHPFKGKWVGMGEAPNPVDLARRGYWPFGPGSLIQPGPSTVPLDIVHTELQRCFHRCFTDGHQQPQQRPTAAEWSQALRQSISSLKVCQTQSNHYYSRTQLHCYWCERKQKLGLDIFDTKQLQQLATTQPKTKTATPVSTARVWKMPSAAVVAPNRPKPFLERYRRELAAGVAFSMAMLCLVILIAPDWQTVYPQIRQMLRWFRQTISFSATPDHLPSLQRNPNPLRTQPNPAPETFGVKVSGNPAGKISALALSPDSNHLALARADSVIQVWQTQSGKLLAKLPTIGDSEPITTLALANNKELISGNRNGTIRVWDYLRQAKLRTLEPSQAPSIFGTPTPVILSGNGQWSVTAAQEDRLLLRDVKTGRVSQTFRIRSSENPSIAITTNGKFLASIDPLGELRLWRLPQGQLLPPSPWQFSQPGLTSAVAISADGQLIARANWEGQVMLWGLQTGQPQKTLSSNAKVEISNLAISQNNRYLIGSGSDNQIRLWDLQSGKILKTLRGHQDKITTLAFSNNNQFFVSSSMDQTAKVWQVPTGKLQRIFR